MTQPDPMATREDTRAALRSPAYLAAFNAAMSGGADTLTDDQVNAVDLVRVLTGTPPPGLPLPLQPEPGATVHVTTGYTPESVVAAVQAGDLSILVERGAR